MVQHIPLGGLLEWNVADSTPERTEPTAHPVSAITQAPWAAGSTVYPTPLPSSGYSSSFSTGMPTYPALPVLHARGRPTHGSSSPRSSPRPTAVPHGISSGPLFSAQLPLGPLANTTLRPIRAPTQSSNVMPPPPLSSSRSPNGDGEHPNEPAR